MYLLSRRDLLLLTTVLLRNRPPRLQHRPLFPNGPSKLSWTSILRAMQHTAMQKLNEDWPGFLDSTRRLNRRQRTVWLPIGTEA